MQWLSDKYLAMDLSYQTQSRVVLNSFSLNLAKKQKYIYFFYEESYEVCNWSCPNISLCKTNITFSVSCFSSSLILGTNRRAYLHWLPHISLLLSGWWVPTCHDEDITRGNQNLVTVQWSVATHPCSMFEIGSWLTLHQAGERQVTASNCCLSRQT